MPKDMKGVVVGARKCRDCKMVKRAERFYPSNPYQCKKCLRDALREHRRDHPEKWATYARRSTLKRRYGMTPEQYEALLRKQNGRCAICCSPHVRRRGINNFAVDHDHKTGDVRSLLCHNCNRGLGHFKDSPVLLRMAANYIESATREKKSA